MQINIDERVKLKGRVMAYIWNAKDVPKPMTLHAILDIGINPIDILESENLVTTNGMIHIAKLIGGVTTNYFRLIGVGSGDTAPTTADTTLETAVGSKISLINTQRTLNKARFETYFSSTTSNGAWRECGLFATTGTSDMLSRNLFPTTVTKDTTNAVTVVWDITITQ